MRLIQPLIVLVSLAVACRASPASWEMHANHAGPVRFGMSAAEATRALGDSATASPATGCTYGRPAKAPGGVNVMIENGVAVRADIDSAGPQTAEGIG